MYSYTFRRSLNFGAASRFVRQRLVKRYLASRRKRRGIPGVARISDATPFLAPLIVALRTQGLSDAVPRESADATRPNGCTRERAGRLLHGIYRFARREPRGRDALGNEARRTCCTGLKKNREPLGRSRCAFPEATSLRFARFRPFVCSRM